MGWGGMVKVNHMTKIKLSKYDKTTTLFANFRPRGIY